MKQMTNVPMKVVHLTANNAWVVLWGVTIVPVYVPVGPPQRFFRRKVDLVGALHARGLRVNARNEVELPGPGSDNL